MLASWNSFIVETDLFLRWSSHRRANLYFRRPSTNSWRKSRYSNTDLFFVATKLLSQEPDGSTDGVDKYPGKLTMEQARNDSSLTWSQSIVSQLPPLYAIQLRRSLLVCDLSASSPVRYINHNNKRTHIESSSPNPPLVLPLLLPSRLHHL